MGISKSQFTPGRQARSYQTSGKERIQGTALRQDEVKKEIEGLWYLRFTVFFELIREKSGAILAIFFLHWGN